MKHGHIKLMVCPHVQHKWDTDARWTLVRHMSDTRSYVSYLKNIIFRFENVSNTIEYSLDTCRTWLGRASDKASTFFSIIWWTEKKFKGPKIQVYLKILFEVSTEIVPHIFWKEYRKYTWYILRILQFFWKGFRK